MYKRILYTLMLPVLCGLAITSCEIEQVNDPNNPSLGSVTNDASKAELQALVTGLETRHRGYYGSATQMLGSFGREVWAFFGSDPRFIDDWLAVGRTETYPDFFASAGTYVTPYLAVKQADVLEKAAAASSSLTAAEAAGYSGFAKTIKGFQLLWPLLQQGDNGIRVDVDEPLNPGPVLGFDQALAAIRQILEDGANDLQGAEFSFSLTEGFAGFSTPETMLQLNRAIAAKAAMYAEDWSGMEAALGRSYLAAGGDLNAGPVHPYGNAPDVNNPLFYPFDRPTNTILIVHPSMIEDAEAGDTRLNKFAERTNTLTTTTSAGVTLTGVYQDARWSGPTDDIPYLRNEELILMWAEAKAQLDKTSEAVEAINIIRNAHGLEDYSGGTSKDELIDEILFQRRYSLWAEAGQRWLDMRRYGRLNGDNIDLRDGGNIYDQVSRRVSEIAWEG